MNERTNFRLNSFPFKYLISLKKINPSLAFCMEPLRKTLYLSRNGLWLDNETDDTEATGHGNQ